MPGMPAEVSDQHEISLSRMGPGMSGPLYQIEMGLSPPCDATPVFPGAPLGEMLGIRKHATIWSGPSAICLEGRPVHVAHFSILSNHTTPFH
jgi:hypothetical protein